MEENVETSKKIDLRLIHTLMIFLFKDEAHRVFESTFLEEFPTTNVNFPVERFSPRRIIESMMEKHSRAAQNISKNLDNLKYFFTHKTVKRHYFTNNMEFHNDIQTICFYYLRVLKYNIHNEPIEDIMKMMINKYGINTGAQTEYCDPTVITFHRIACSFPSVMLDMFCYDLGGYCTFIRRLFLDFELCPCAIFSPVIVSILPQLKDPPIAILTAIALKLDDISHPKYLTPLAIIHKRVFVSYLSTAFPESLKLQLCMKWYIVMKEKNEYIFNPIFKQYREEAKRVISTRRSRDPDLENLLSRM